MTQNITDQSRSIRLADSASRTCEATEKYANVKSPVVAMPIERMRAPRPEPGASSCSSIARSRVASDPDKQHRPRERRAGLDDRPVARQQLDERALRPVVEMPRSEERRV